MHRDKINFKLSLQNYIHQFLYTLFSDLVKSVRKHVSTSGDTFVVVHIFTIVACIFINKKNSTNQLPWRVDIGRWNKRLVVENQWQCRPKSEYWFASSNWEQQHKASCLCTNHILPNTAGRWNYSADCIVIPHSVKYKYITFVNIAYVVRMS